MAANRKEDIPGLLVVWDRVLDLMEGDQIKKQ